MLALNVSHRSHIADYSKTWYKGRPWNLFLLPSLCVSIDTILTCTQSGCMIIQITIRLLSYSAFVYRADLLSHDGGFYVLVPAWTNTITVICMIYWYHLLVYCPQKDTEFGNNTVFWLKWTDSPFSFIRHKAQRRLFGSVIDTTVMHTVTCNISF